MSASGTPDQTPLVSVVMPIRGGDRFIAPALDSVLLQTCRAIEIVCVDDGIATAAMSVLQSAISHGGPVRILHNEGKGIVAALNTGLRKARGVFIARMDADDVSLPSRFDAQLRYLAANPDVGAVGTQADLIDSEGKILRRLHVPIGKRQVARSLEVSCALIHPSVMMRSSILRRLGGYREGFDGAEDHELWLRMRETCAIDNLPDRLLLYRAHDRQVSFRRQFHQARLSALAIVGSRLAQEMADELFERMAAGQHWRHALARLSPAAVEQVKRLTACALADNGGTVRSSGASYLRLACRRSTDDVRDRERLALACVRHQVGLVRQGRRMEAISAAVNDATIWRARLLRAYFRQLSAVWRSSQGPLVSRR